MLHINLPMHGILRVQPDIDSDTVRAVQAATRKWLNEILDTLPKRQVAALERLTGVDRSTISRYLKDDIDEKHMMSTENVTAIWNATGVAPALIVLFRGFVPVAFVAPAPHLPTYTNGSNPNGKRELVHGPLSKDAEFQVLVTGRVGPEEFDHLIARLQLDKKNLID